MSTAIAAEFEEWWEAFPRKVGKLAAMKEYAKARKLATAQQLREGVGRYIANKPAYADYCHAKTWLSQGRWLDSYDEPVRTRTIKFEQSDLHQQMYRNNPKYRAEYDAKKVSA